MIIISSVGSLCTVSLENVRFKVKKLLAQEGVLSKIGTLQVIL